MKRCTFTLISILLAAGVGADEPTAATNAAPAQLPEVVVTGTRIATAPDGSATNGYRFSTGSLGPLGTLSLQETPYSINVTSGELIENRVVHSPTEALRTVPTVAPLMSESGYSSMHRVMVRGFTAADQSELRDGLTDRSFTIQPMENVERIEILNGFSGFLYGYSALGGTVNYVSKRPTATRLTTLTVGAYDNGVCFGHVDVGGPVVAGLGYRANAYYENGTTYCEDQERQRDLLSLDLAYRLNEKLDLNLAFYHQDLDMSGIGTYFDISGIGNRVPDPVDPTKQYGQSWTYNRSQKDVVSLQLESHLNDIFTVRMGGLYGTMWRDYRFVKAKFTDLNGGYRESMVDTPRNEEEANSGYALVDAEFDTGPVGHKVTAGYTRWGFTFRRGADRTLTLGFSTVQEPVSYAVAGEAGEIDRWQTTDTHNFLIADRLTLAQWTLLAGVNYALSDTWYYGNYVSKTALPSGYSGPTSSKDHTSAHALTPTVALLYECTPGVNLYGSYLQGIEPGGTAPTTAANAGEILDTSVSQQYEAGIKASLTRKFDVTLAAFRLEKVNSYTDPADNVYKQDGRQVHKGLELFGTGRLWDCLTVVGGFTVMSAEIRRAANSATEGETPVNIPEQMASLYLEYQLPRIHPIPGTITLTAGCRYYGKRPVDVPNQNYISDVTLFDAGLRYQPIEQLTFNLSVTNLADTRYWQYYRSGDGLLSGSPRVFAVSAKYSF